MKYKLRQLPIDRVAPIIVFLQNAWSPVYAGAEWPRELWLAALIRSRSGQRLRMLVRNPDWCENTTPIIGSTPSSVMPPDFCHIQNVLATRKPRIVVACGKQAEEAVRILWSGSLIAVPHPASRVLTDQLYLKAAALIDDGFTGRIALRQEKGGFRLESLA